MMPKIDPNAALDAALARIAKLETNASLQSTINDAMTNALIELRREIDGLKPKKKK